MLTLPKYSMLLTCHQSDLGGKKVIWHETILRKHFTAERIEAHHFSKQHKELLCGISLCQMSQAVHWVQRALFALIF